jgi:hypothetical protein
LLILAASGSGCAAAAATQLLPLAFQGTEVAGIMVGSAVSGKEPTEDTEDTEERCDALAATPPYMGELVQTDGGQAVRGLILGEENGAPRWFLSTTVTSLDALQFSSPVTIPGEDSKKKHDFLAYAPAQPQDSRENNQLIAFLGSFDSGPGVLSISGRNYRYAWVEKLPCFKPAQ